MFNFVTVLLASSSDGYSTFTVTAEKNYAVSAIIGASQSIQFTRSTYVPMPQWGWMTAAHILLDPQHPIAKTHADTLSNYWVSRQTEQCHRK